MNEQMPAEVKLEQIKQLHAPAYYFLVRRKSDYFGWVTEALCYGDKAPSDRVVDFVLCAVCHSNTIDEDTETGYYYGHTGSYPCETMKIVQQ